MPSAIVRCELGDVVAATARPKLALVDRGPGLEVDPRLGFDNVEDEPLGSEACAACKRDTVVLSGTSGTPAPVLRSGASGTRTGVDDGVDGGERNATFLCVSLLPLPADGPRAFIRAFAFGSGSVSGVDEVIASSIGGNGRAARSGRGLIGGWPVEEGAR